MKKKTTSRYAMSRRCRDVFFIAAIVIAAAFVIADHTAIKPFRQSIIENKQRGKDGQKYHNKIFTVVKVIDGDTFDINIPDGQSNTTRIRVIGIDTPETKDPRYPAMYFGQESYEQTKRLLLNQEVTLSIDTISDSRDYYGRLLCYVQISNGKDFGEIMLSEGYAYAYLRFEHSRYDEYTMLQQQALENKKGLWKNVTYDQLPQWLREEKPDTLKN